MHPGDLGAPVTPNGSPEVQRKAGQYKTLPWTLEGDQDVPERIYQGPHKQGVTSSSQYISKVRN